MDERALTGVVVDAGHGGNDPGSSANGIVEKDYNLRISQYIYDRLKQLGVPVKMVRTGDETLTPEERVARVKNAFGPNKDVVVLSNHLNAGGGDGAEVIYALRNSDTLSKLILEEIGKEGQNIRRAYQRRLPSDTSKDYYFMQRNTAPTESVTIEYGFLDGPKDDPNLIKNNWRNLAEATVRGFARYKNIPYTAPGGSTQSPSATSHVVKKGDSLYSIAQEYGTTVDAIKNLNKLTSNVLQIGQILNIPGTTSTNPSSSNTYVVKKGDSLYSIASQYGISVDELKKANSLTSNVLQIGQVLNIPTTSNNNSGNTNPNTHTVSKGDSLYSIANKYGITVDELRKANNLISDILQIGQILNIPSSSSNENQTVNPSGTHTVKSGDTLYKIANTYGTTVSELKRINGLMSDVLSLGQVLVIPSSMGKTYTVKKGDTLWNIAKQFDTTADKIKQLNGMTSNTLSIGQILQIP